MSEVIFCLLFHLYPSHFRQEYGAEALQLFRDRTHNETGLWPSVRLWFDLLADLVISLPREYCYKRPDIATAPAKTCLNGTPTFFVFDTASPGRRPLLLGGLLSLITLVSFPRLMIEFGNFRPPSGWSFASPGAYERQGGDPQRPASGSEQGVQSPRGANPTLDATSRHRIIASAIASIKQHHIDPLEAPKAADALLAHERQGDDDSATSTEEFTRLATKQMREATGDHQLELLYSPRAIPERPAGPPPALPTAYRHERRRVNCAFERVEILVQLVVHLQAGRPGSPRVSEGPARAAIAPGKDLASLLARQRRQGEGL